MPDNLNLSPERGPNVWDRPTKSNPQRKWEIGAAVLLAAGAGMLLAGGTILYRAMQLDREPTRRRPSWNRATEDLVTEESQQSFPASDAPSWTSSDGATLDLPRRTH